MNVLAHLLAYISDPPNEIATDNDEAMRSSACVYAANKDTQYRTL